MASTAKLTTGSGVPRAETISEQFTSLGMVAATERARSEGEPSCVRKGRFVGFQVAGPSRKEKGRAREIDRGTGYGLGGLLEPHYREIKGSNSSWDDFY